MEKPFNRIPRRVLMTADTIGGVWTYALELARALEPHGIEFTIATMGAWLTPEQIKEARSLSNVEICESDFKLEWMDSPWRDMARAGEWLLRLAAKRRPDVIHLNNYAHGALDWKMPVLVVAHSCVLSWFRAVKGECAPAEWDTYRKAVCRGIRAADCVVAPSRTMLECARHLYGPLPKSEVIYNARQPDSFRPGPKKNLVLTAGRFWDEAKNIAALANVAPELPWPIHVAGETKSPNGTDHAMEHLLPLGRLSARELAPWFAQASIYALPALYEPFGLSILEAALAGCALVLGDIPSLREIWGGAALFVPPRDPVALKTALRRLMENDGERKEMAARARSRALEYSPQRMADGYLSVYEQLVACQEGHHQQEEFAVCES
ncbi:MAG TPA: glycosyltransferase family 4 protein [Verrucomicrobiae bacterium]|nr:glycosyltransferase family 4 protein [Verrucomicrobiae bacterium]